MQYNDLRQLAKTGDLLLLEGKDLTGVLVRVLTAQQISHVAMLVWVDDGLWVAEMRNAGYSLAPASQRVAQMLEGGTLYWGEAPSNVALRAIAVQKKLLSFRGTRYSWWSLLSVWASQLVKRRLPRNMVCSTLVEEVWKVAGIAFSQTPDPGDLLPMCEAVTPIKATLQG